MFEIGTILDKRYQIQAHLGTGGMGEVYRVLDLEQSRECALKILKIAEADSLSQAESGLWEGGDNGGEDEGNCEHCDDENCDGCANNDDEGDDGSGLPDEESSTEGNNG